MTEEINVLEMYKHLINNLDDNYTDNIINNIIKLIPEGATGLKIRVINLILTKTKELEAPIGIRYLNRLFKKLKESQNESIPIYQIERTIAEYITNKYTIITFETTDEICLYKDGVFLTNKPSRAKIRKEILRIVKEKYQEYQETLSKRAMIFEIIKNMTFYPMEKFGLEANIINLRNGIIQQKDNRMIFKSHGLLKREGIILYTFNQLPVYYNKNAKCPILDKILPEIFGNDQLIDVMEFISYVLVHTLDYDKAIMFQGPPKTGKTTFINMLTQFLGRRNISGLELYRLSKPFQVENLRFKMANISDDVAPLPFRYGACSWIKKLITNAYLEGELKNVQGNKDWINYCKLICACNRLPIPEDDGDAFWRRWIGISCINQFKGKIRNSKLKLMKWSKEEMSGFLNKCVIAWRRLYKRGEFREKWESDPDFIKLWWMSNIKPVFEFVNKYCNVGDPDQSIDYEDFINCFNKYRNDRGLKELSKTLITRELNKIHDRIKVIKVNVSSNPLSSGHKYHYIGWNGLLFVEGNETVQIAYRKIIRKTSDQIKKEYKDSLIVNKEYVKFDKLDIDEDIEVYDSALGKTVKINEPSN